MNTTVATLSLVALLSASATQVALAGEKSSREATAPQRVEGAPLTKSEVARNANVTYARKYDRKYNTTYYFAVQPQSEFVGTSARAGDPKKAKPSWYQFGHP